MEAIMRSNVVRSMFAVALFCATAAHAQTVDEIVAMNLKAKGGVEKWNAVKTVRMTGTISAQGKALPMTVYAKRPNSTRQEVSVGDRTMVQAFDGSVAWATDPRMNGMPQQAPPAVSDRARTNAALINYKEKGTVIDFVGKETLDGRDVFHLKVTLRGGEVQQYFLDAQSGLEVKTSAEVDPMGTGQKQTMELVMSDYRDVDGIMLPHSIKQFLNAKPVMETKIDKVELNPVVDETLFRMPKK
jgi:hypothetical protein